LQEGSSLGNLRRNAGSARQAVGRRIVHEIRLPTSDHHPGPTSVCRRAPAGIMRDHSIMFYPRILLHPAPSVKTRAIISTAVYDVMSTSTGTRPQRRVYALIGTTGALGRRCSDEPGALPHFPRFGGPFCRSPLTTCDRFAILVGRDGARPPVCRRFLSAAARRGRVIPTAPGMARVSLVRRNAAQLTAAAA
jgi:hypothetical protein